MQRKKEPFIFSAGRLWDEAKNVRLLAEISSQLPWKVVVAGDCGEEFRSRGLIGMHVILQQFGIVIGHLFKVGNDPALVDRIAMKASSELVVDAAARHFLER